MTLDQEAVSDALPSYDVGGELGRGGWGVVLAGKHRQLGRDVAIKQLPRAFAADPSIRSRFTVEARTLASLDHPHIVPVYDFVEQDGLCLLVMELLPGGTVWSRFTADGFTGSGACAVVLACLSGLQAAHAHRVLHRDVKPENLMFSTSGALKVTDFGIAKVVGGEDTMTTRAGEVVGTPAYIAPEQARGGELSPATDVYATATMLYELLSGQLPFDDDGDAMALMFKHAFDQPTPLLEKAPSVPASVAAVVMSGLATDPAERPATAEAFGIALAEACTAAWGPGWLPSDGTPVMGANSILAATERPTVPPPTPAANAASISGAVLPESPADIPPPPATGAPATMERPPASPTMARPPTMPVRPTFSVHVRSAALGDIEEPALDLIPVKEVLTPPPSPARWFIGALVFAIAALLVALVGVGAPAKGGSLSAGEVRVAGTDVVNGGTVKIDLSKPIPVTVSASAPAANHVELSANVLGQQVSSATAPLVSTAAGRAATVSLGGRYLVGGSFTGKVTLWNGLAAGDDATFDAHTTQSGLLSVPAVVTLLLLLFVIGYAESLSRSLRRNKSRRTGPVGLTLIGAVFGVAAVGIGWVVFRQVPTAVSLILCAILGAVAGLALALGAIGVSKQRRFRRVQRREERRTAKAAA
jgi:serine/threonine protein kinase